VRRTLHGVLTVRTCTARDWATMFRALLSDVARWRQFEAARPNNVFLFRSG